MNSAKEEQGIFIVIGTLRCGEDVDLQGVPEGVPSNPVLGVVYDQVCPPRGEGRQRLFFCF